MAYHAIPALIGNAKFCVRVSLVVARLRENKDHFPGPAPEQINQDRERMMRTPNVTRLK